MSFRTILSFFTTKIKTLPVLGANIRKPSILGHELILPCSYTFIVCGSISTKTNYLLASRKSQNGRGVSSKIEIISRMNFKNDEDAKPFQALPVRTLYQIHNNTLSDVRNGFCENRLYYISSKIQCPPAQVSEKLAKRTFVYNLPFQWLDNSLSELLEKGVSGERILRDLWVLKYHHKTIRERLQRIKDSSIVNLYPWMVRCSPDILNRYLKLTKETKSILGESNSTLSYIANRLNISIEEVEELCIKMPALRTIRAIKVKHFLDFLLNEGFNIEQIAAKPRILASSQKTVKKRLEQLRQLGEKDINLNLLCRSKKDFKRICEALGAKDGKIWSSLCFIKKSQDPDIIIRAQEQVL